MLDRLDDFRTKAQNKGFSLNLSAALLKVGDDESGISTESDLMADFLVSAKLAIKEIQKMEINNAKLKEISDKQVNENLGSN